jgi:hypothetical protein
MLAAGRSISTAAEGQLHLACQSRRRPREKLPASRSSLENMRFSPDGERSCRVGCDLVPDRRWSDSLHSVVAWDRGAGAIRPTPPPVHRRGGGCGSSLAVDKALHGKPVRHRDCAAGPRWPQAHQSPGRQPGDSGHERQTDLHATPRAAMSGCQPARHGTRCDVRLPTRLAWNPM